MSFPAGVYRIARWGSHEHGQILTVKDDHVTVLPPGAAPEKDQEVIVVFFLQALAWSVTNQCLLTVASRGRRGRQSRHPDPRQYLSFPFPFL